MCHRWSWFSIIPFLIPSASYAFPLRRSTTSTSIIPSQSASSTEKDTASNFFNPSRGSSIGISVLVGLALVAICALLVVFISCCCRNKRSKPQANGKYHEAAKSWKADREHHPSKSAESSTSMDSGYGSVLSHSCQQSLVLIPQEQNGEIVLVSTLIYEPEHQTEISSTTPKVPPPAKLRRIHQRSHHHNKTGSSESFAATRSFDSNDESTLVSGRSSPAHSADNSISSRSQLSRHGSSTLVRTQSGRFNMVRSSVLLAKPESESCTCPNCGCSPPGLVPSSAHPNGRQSPYIDTFHSDFNQQNSDTRTPVQDFHNDESLGGTFLAPRVAPPPPTLDFDPAWTNPTLSPRPWADTFPLPSSPSSKHHREASTFDRSGLEVAYLGATCPPSPAHYDPTPPQELAEGMGHSNTARQYGHESPR